MALRSWRWTETLRRRRAAVIRVLFYELEQHNAAQTRPQALKRAPGRGFQGPCGNPR